MLSGLLAAVAATTVAASAQPVAAQGPPSLRFGAAQQVTPDGDRVLRSEPVGALDDAGRALLVWSETERRRSRIVVATAPAGGPFGAPRRLARGSAPQLGVAPDGHAVIAFSGARGGRVSVGDTSGRFGTPASLLGRRRPSAVAMGGDGTAAVVSANLDRGSTVQLVAPGGRLGAIRRFDQYVPDGTLLVGEDGSAGFGAGEVAAGPDGTIALITRTGVLERRPGEATFARAHRPLRGRIADPQVAVGADGTVGLTAVVRPLCIGEYGCVGEIALVERRAGATRFAAPVRAPVARHPKDGGRRVASGFAPRIAYGTQGAPLLTWTEDVRICTECDMDLPSGPRVAWRGFGERTALGPGSSRSAPAGGGVAITVSDDLEEAAQGIRTLWLAAEGPPRPVAAPEAFLRSASDLLAGGPTRLLVADGGYHEPIRAALADIIR